jgi:hypothetical protein
MLGTVITISPRVPVAELERRARALVARDGVAVYAAVTADGRQRHHLLRLRKLLAAGPGLDVYGGTGRPDRTTWLIVCQTGGRPAYFGDARTG